MSILSEDEEQSAATVADRIVRTACEDAETQHPGRDAVPIERNARRRVYDALKVMVSVGSVQRDAKRLRWIGVDHIQDKSACLQNKAASKYSQLKIAICKARTTIGRKKAMAEELQRRIDAFHIVQVRRRTEQSSQSHKQRRAMLHKFYFPLMFINAKDPAVTLSRGRAVVRVDTTAPFTLFSETDVVCRLAERYAPGAKRVRRNRAARARNRAAASCISRRYEPSDSADADISTFDIIANTFDAIVNTDVDADADGDASTETGKASDAAVVSSPVRSSSSS